MFTVSVPGAAKQTDSRKGALCHVLIKTERRAFCESFEILQPDI